MGMYLIRDIELSTKKTTPSGVVFFCLIVIKDQSRSDFLLDGGGCDSIMFLTLQISFIQLNWAHKDEHRRLSANAVVVSILNIELIRIAMNVILSYSISCMMTG